MKYLFICYPKCSTCRKARNFLEENDIEFVERNIKEDRPNVKELKEWISKGSYSIKRFFNTSGKLYREMNLKTKLSGMTEDEQIELLATDGMHIKRPILIGENTVLVGFKEKEWSVLKKK